MHFAFAQEDEVLAASPLVHFTIRENLAWNPSALRRSRWIPFPVLVALVSALLRPAGSLRRG